MWEKLSHSMRKVGDMVGIEEGFIVKAMTGTSFSTFSDVSDSLFGLLVYLKKFHSIFFHI